MRATRIGVPNIIVVGSVVVSLVVGSSVLQFICSLLVRSVVVIVECILIDVVVADGGTLDTWVPKITERLDTICVH